MKKVFFRTLLATALVSGLSIGIFTTLVMIFYKNPLNSMPIGFDFLFFLAFPIWAILYYKLKVNNRVLDFKDGLVLGAIVSFVMFAFFATSILLANALNPTIFEAYKEDWLKDLAQNKKLWLERVKTEEDYQNLIAFHKNSSVFSYLFRQLGIKTIILLFVSVVGATAFRAKPQPNLQKAKK